MKANNQKKSFDRGIAPAQGRWCAWCWLTKSKCSLRIGVTLLIGICFLFVTSRFVLPHFAEETIAAESNRWHVTTVPAFQCDNLTLSECLSKFNAMNVGGGTFRNNPLRVRIDDSTTTISGTTPDYLSRKQFADMLAEAGAYNQTTNMSLLLDMAQTRPITLNAKNVRAAELIISLMELAGLSSASINFGSSGALIRRGPKELKVCAMKAPSHLKALLITNDMPNLANETPVFRESRDSLSVRYHVPSGDVIVLATPSYLALIMRAIESFKGSPELILEMPGSDHVETTVP